MDRGETPQRIFGRQACRSVGQKMISFHATFISGPVLLDGIRTVTSRDGPSSGGGWAPNRGTVRRRQRVSVGRRPWARQGTCNSSCWTGAGADPSSVRHSGSVQPHHNYHSRAGQKIAAQARPDQVPAGRPGCENAFQGLCHFLLSQVLLSQQQPCGPQIEGSFGREGALDGPRWDSTGPRYRATVGTDKGQGHRQVRGW